MALALAAALFVVILAPVGAWLWLTSEGGERWLRAKVVSAAGEAIHGRLELDGVSLQGLLRLELRGVRLYAPEETEPAVSLARAVLDVRLAALLARRLDLAELVLEEPKVRLVPGEDGSSNLARAVASRRPAAPEEEPAGDGKLPEFSVNAPVIAVRGAAFRREGSSPLDVGPVDLSLGLSGRLDDLAAQLALSIRTTEPIAREVQVEVKAKYRGESAELERLVVTSGQSRLALSGEGRLDGAAATLRSLELHLAAADVRELAPEVELLGDVDLTGRATLREGAVDGELHLALPAGSVHLEANVTLPDEGAGRPIGYRARMKIADVDPQRIVAGLPAALLAASVGVEGEGLPPESRGRITLDASGSRYEELTIDRLEAAATVEGLVAQVEKLTVGAAGVSFSADGKVSRDDAALSFQVEAPRLSATRRALEDGLGLSLPEAAGAISVSGTLEGPPTEPALTVRLAAPSASYGDYRVERVRVGVSVTRIQPTPHGRIQLEVGSLDASGMHGENLAVGAVIDGSELRADVGGVLDGRPLGLRLRGTRRAPSGGRERWSVAKLGFSALGASMETTRPVELEVGGGRAKVDLLEFAGTFGRLRVAGEGGSEGPLRARIGLDDFRLDRIPKELLSSPLPVDGVVQAEVNLSGTRAAPVVDARVRFLNGRYQELGPLAVDADARVARGRATFSGVVGLPADGHVRLAGSAALDAWTRRDKPLQLSVLVENLDLATAATLAPSAGPLAGKIDGVLRVEGSLAQPVMSMRLQADGVAARGLDALGAWVDLTYGARQLKLDARVARPQALDVALLASAPIDLPALLEAPRQLAGGMVRGGAELDIGRLDLGWLARAGLAPEDLTGAMTGRLVVEGNLEDPRASGSIQLTKISKSGYEDVNALLELAAAEDVSVKLESQMGGLPLADVTARVKAPLLALSELSAAELTDLPLSVSARLHPTSLARLRGSGEGTSSSSMRGFASGSLVLTGSANEPRATLLGRVDELRVDGRSVGRMELRAKHRDVRTTADLVLLSENAGSLSISSRLEGSLGARVLREEGARSLLSRNAVIHVRSKEFDLAVLEGLSSSVRDLSGRLDLDLTKRGPLDGYELHGRMTLHDGRMTVIEMGSYSGLEVDADFAYPMFKLNRLAGSSRGGTFDVRAEVEGDRAMERVAGSMEVDLSALPIVKAHQTRGFLTMKMRASGALQDGVVTIPELRISKGLLRIPEKLPKSVQSLDPHSEVVFIGEAPPELVSRRWPLIRVGLVIPDDFTIDAPLGTSLILGTRLDLTRDQTLAEGGRSPYDVVGTVKMVRGTINLLGRHFNVDEGRVQFLPRNWDDPSLAIKATYEGREATVHVDITGTANEPKTNFTSQPPMEPSDIFMYLVTGQRQDRARTDTPGVENPMADAGLAILGSTVAGVVKGALRQVLPKELEPDILAVETKGGAVRTRAGKFLTERIYIGTQINSGADPTRNENVVEVEGEYRINPETYVRGRGGDAGKFAGELMFLKNLPTREQRTAKKER